MFVLMVVDKLGKMCKKRLVAILRGGLFSFLYLNPPISPSGGTTKIQGRKPP